MSVMFFFICSKFNQDFKDADKNSDQLLCFWDNSRWIGCVNYSLLRKEYLSWAENVVTNTLKILHITKSDFFKLNCLYSSERILWNCRRSDFNSVWSLLRCCLLKDTVRWQFLDIYLTKFLEACNFRNTLTMSVTFFFWKCSKFNLDFKQADKNAEKVFVFEISAYE